MLAQRRIGQAQRQFLALATRRSCRARCRHRRAAFDNAVLREVNRRALQNGVSSAELIDDEFDELDCSPEVLLRLANQP